MVYSLINSYSGEALLSGFDWFNGEDPSHGCVNYQSRDEAEGKGLFSIDEVAGTVRLGVDSTNVYTDGQGRPSIRLESKETYQHGLFIADFLHMPPSQCGVWPAFWTYGGDWPNGGEVDIIEGANTAHHNLISAHTSKGCVQDPSLSGLYSGFQRNTDCYVGDFNIGCGFDPPAHAYGSYGDAFNAQYGGVYAMLWDEEHIKIWHFPRSQIPADIESRSPEPEGWGQPYAVFGGSGCEIDQYFKNMRLVLNINFCGDYGDALWGRTDNCNAFASTCDEFVGGNPQAFASTYWDVRYIDAYALGEGHHRKGGEEPRTTTTMTSHHITTVTVGGEGEGERPVAPIPDLTVDILVNPTTIQEYEYLGCYGSAPSFTKVKECKDMTLEICVEQCREQQIPYAGVCGYECFCGEGIDTEMRATSGPRKCNKPCRGNPEACCGGGDEGEEQRLYTVYGCVKEDVQLPLPPPMAVPLAHDIAHYQEYVATVGDCDRCQKSGPRPPAPTPGPAPGDPPFPSPSPAGGGEGHGERPPHNPVVVVSRANPRQPPSNLSVIFGALAMVTVMMVI